MIIVPPSNRTAARFGSKAYRTLNGAPTDLDPQLAHAAVPRSRDTRTVRVPERRPPEFEEFDFHGNPHLLGLGQLLEPGIELVSGEDDPFYNS